MMFDYPEIRRVVYEGGATFVPVCLRCGQFVRADRTIMVSEGLGLREQPNGTCKRCGRVEMSFEGFV